MFERLVFGLVFLALLLLPASTVAQETEAPKSFVYATYFECSNPDQWRADEIVETVFAPVYDKAMSDKKITGWGWLSHNTGGKWRRLSYRVAPTVDKLLEAGEAIFNGVREANTRASQEFGKICGTHEDYIWEFDQGSVLDPAKKPHQEGEAGFSIYLDCDMSREERADELVTEVFAPLYEKQVAEGNLHSWGWLKHRVGGKYRRVATMRAANHGTLLKARGAIITQLQTKHEAAATEFNKICHSHQDYMWNIEHRRP